MVLKRSANMKCDCCGKELTNGNREANILICKECAEKNFSNQYIVLYDCNGRFWKEQIWARPRKAKLTPTAYFILKLGGDYE